ncbi:hypothetical protein P7C70_g7818, partial [Phenoliferia sp. Uapishka_3]
MPPSEQVHTESETDENEWEVTAVLKHRYVKSNLEYKVRWKGYGPSDDSWISASDANAPALIDVYWTANPPDLRVKVTLNKRLQSTSGQSNGKIHASSPKRGRGRPLKQRPAPKTEARISGEALGGDGKVIETLEKETEIRHGTSIRSDSISPSGSGSGSRSGGKAKDRSTGSPDRSERVNVDIGTSLRPQYERKRASIYGLGSSNATASTSSSKISLAFAPPPAKLHTSASGEQKKKRGRPSNAELAARARLSDQPPRISATTAVRLGEECEEDGRTQKKSKKSYADDRNHSQSKSKGKMRDWLDSQDGRQDASGDLQDRAASEVTSGTTYKLDVQSSLDQGIETGSISTTLPSAARHPSRSLSATSADGLQVEPNETKFASIKKWENLIRSIDTLSKVDGVIVILAEWYAHVLAIS